MKISMEVVIQSGEDEVDMDFALQSLLGTASVACLSTEGILNGKVIERRTTANEIRAKLKQSFKSSYGQRFEIHFSRSSLESRYRKIGKDAFIEVMSYYIREALYLESDALSQKAKKVINELEAIEENLTDRLRSPLSDMHKITTTNNYNVVLRSKVAGENVNLITLNEQTASNIMGTTLENTQETIDVVITRFNSMTGNGRLIIRDQIEEKTTAFGFSNMIRFVRDAEKSAVSNNLHNNNGAGRDDWEYLRMRVNRLVKSNGETVKYIIIDVTL